MKESTQLPFGPAPQVSGVDELARTKGAAGPKVRRRVGAGGLIACMLAAGLFGGGTVAGATTLLKASSPAASTAQAAEFTPVIVNNAESVNAVTAAAQRRHPVW
ncbi:hypothetical protein QFZ79_004443 [Arthrobacter sp. V4I6]|uniref:hypothetical protein n=1 Tax=unclassified Arthrobacter TaxID=235627 RepID=UPI002787A99E|nr:MULTISPECIES: hypothetical protein [unclassified Arthrobacter]MDQ0822064.1 hypothetical protein [Arthrobacter sp. V1I7]MDQ0856332.1 hypothetical protein [Arthrobacter sp. V4I6]